MLAVIFAIMSFCPLLHTNIDAVQPYHTDDFSFVGSAQYRVRLTNPSPFAFATDRIDVFVRDEQQPDVAHGKAETFPKVTVPGHTSDSNGVDVTFHDDALDFRLLVGALVVCDGIAP